MRDARKLFRLFKTINEVKKIQDLLKAELTMENVLSILVRVFFGIYWFFDNLNILSKIKILSHDPKKMGKLGATFWLLALATNLVLLVKQLVATVAKVNKVKAKKYGSMSDSEARDRKKELGTLLVKRQALLLNVVKVVGDIIPAGQGSEFFP